MEKATDKQIGGDHYKNFEIQPIEFIFANRSQIGFLEGNVIKYTCRHKSKGGEKDIDKAIHYLELIKQLQYKKLPESVYVIDTVQMRVMKWKNGIQLEHFEIPLPSRFDSKEYDIIDASSFNNGVNFGMVKKSTALLDPTLNNETIVDVKDPWTGELLFKVNPDIIEDKRLPCVG